MIRGFMLLVLCQFAGEAVVSATGVAFPGPLAGMLLLLVYMTARGRVDRDVEQVSQAFLRHMGLLFVPAGAGLSLYFDLLARDWPTVLAAALSSAALTLLATAGLHRLLAARP